MARTKTFDELMKEYGHTSISDADLALGRDNPAALETILEARGNWANLKKQYDSATDPEERRNLKDAMDAENNRANTQRRAYGNYSGGVDGMGGKYSPTYQKPAAAEENDNVTALYDRFNNLYGKQNAPTWTPQYEEEISALLDGISNRGAFEYDLNTDPLYQQYRDQYIREGQRAMQDAAAQTAALTGGYGSTYGAVAAQQAYDNYLAGLNDRVPQLEQYAYGKYLDETDAMYNQLDAYQRADDRLYGQYLDALGQYNADRDYAFNAMQAAIGQNNYENEWNRGIFESDRGYDLEKNAIAADLALATGDYSALREMGIDPSYLEQQQAMDILYAQQKAAKKSSGGSDEDDEVEYDYEDEYRETETIGYGSLKAIYELYGETDEFDRLAINMINNGDATQEDYDKLLAQVTLGKVKVKGGDELDLPISILRTVRR